IPRFAEDFPDSSKLLTGRYRSPYCPERKYKRLTAKEAPLLCEIPGVIPRAVHFQRWITDEQCRVMARQHRVQLWAGLIKSDILTEMFRKQHLNQRRRGARRAVDSNASHPLKRALADQQDGAHSCVAGNRDAGQDAQIGNGGIRGNRDDSDIGVPAGEQIGAARRNRVLDFEIIAQRIRVWLMLKIPHQWSCIQKADGGDAQARHSGTYYQPKI